MNKTKTNLKKITHLNPAICSENMGDYIISDAVKDQLYDMYPKAMFFEAPTQDKIYKQTYKLITQSDYTFVGGTNLLSSNMYYYNQWNINFLDALHLKNIILMGVGWWQYQNKPSLYTKILFKSVLNHNILHSVRDSYTEEKMHQMGFKNVINTGCPTMWKLSEEHCKTIPHQKAQDVVFTLTDYNKNTFIDQKFIDILCKNYDRVYFWPQGSGDLDYIHTLHIHNNVEIIGANIYAFNQLLKDSSIDLDYIGTRLHGGIRALQKRRRTIIIGIDNRAEEKAKDFNLTVISRENLDKLHGVIREIFATKLRLPEENIAKWKAQFQ